MTPKELLDAAWKREPSEESTELARYVNGALCRLDPPPSEDEFLGRVLDAYAAQYEAQLRVAVATIAKLEELGRDVVRSANDSMKRWAAIERLAAFLENSLKESK